jgi:hypothetical protein
MRRKRLARSRVARFRDTEFTAINCEERAAMAKIWLVDDWREPAAGMPWVDLPLREAIEIFDFGDTDFIADSAKTTYVAHHNQDLYYDRYQYTVVEVDKAEARREKLKPGFYKSQVRPPVAYGKLIENALASALGKENVVRTKYAFTTDWRGQDAVLVTVVIHPNAIARLGANATLDALVKLRQRQHEMNDERTPIVEYATEAELAENAGHQS